MSYCPTHKRIEPDCVDCVTRFHCEQRDKLEAERDKLKAQYADYDKKFAEQGYAFQEAIQRELLENQKLKARVEKLEKEAEAGKQLNRDMLNCIEADMQEDFDMDEMVNAIQRYESIVFPIAKAALKQEEGG